MFSPPLMVRAAATVLIALAASAGSAAAESPADEVRTALAELNQWLDANSTGPGWRKFLRTSVLEGILESPHEEDPAAVAGIVRRYALGAPETDRPRFLRVRRALEDWLAQLPPPSEAELPAALEKAKGAFVRRTAADVAAAEKRLREALDRLDAFLAPSGTNSQQWRTYLRWDELPAQLAGPDGPDLRTLDEIYALYAAGHEGLDLVPFDDVRLALYAYLTTARAVDAPQLESHYQQLLAALPEHLASYRQKPSAEGAARLSSAIQWLDDAAQAPWIAKAIREHFTQPNLFGYVAAGVVAAGIEEPVDEVGPVRDYILGTTIRGTGHTVGEVTVELVPNDEVAETWIVFRGTVASDTIGYNGPARVFSNGVTEIETRKAIFLDENGFRPGPAQSEADTSSRIRGVSAGRGGVAERAATKRVYEQKRQAEYISAQHAEAQASDRADRQVQELIADAQQQFLTDFREPLQERKLFPKEFRFSTTADAVHLTGLQVGPYDLGAPGSPPDAMPDADMAVRVHESLINNLAEEALAGMIVTERQFRETIVDVLGEVPERFEPEEGQEPWKITFDRREPVTVTLSEGQFRITIHGRSYASGDSSYPAMDVTAVYSIAQGDDGPKAVRQGELEIFPPGFDPGGTKRLSARHQTIRRMLERRLGKIFEPEFVPEPLELPGRWEKTGDYALKQWDIADGWMVMAWKQIPGSESEPTPLTEAGQGQ